MTIDPKDPNHIAASDIPDSIKTVAWWKLQNDIADANKKGDAPREMRLLHRQQKLAKELLKKAEAA